ncbi:hypothetical protein AA101099_2019 [Neoasaia chiangmaiensis NBRC 101099]|uniref:Integral membrane bound transporter domain-containing protein n=1 Tax=Neoasaia chiangmaiensis TaxID=320497 RepID=A0A1U9KTD4_9PROT|nr:FUSC family protein [Neoasaia chiangmaiensis]AQS88977.1 hypothetical protein A0U93_14800 [Neoasaia chiangmaiensis]GBR40242.1 hypothetical protein AA101099_2019 [Neoasaia chiangmaiensis NBRC 101099]
MGDASSHAPSFSRRLLAALSRRLARHAIALTPEQFSLWEGLRAAVATATALVPALYLHRPLYAWIAFATFWACLIDPGGTDRQRVQILGGFTLYGGVVVALTTWLVHFSSLAVFPILLLVGIGSGLARMFSPVVMQLCLLIGAASVAATGFPQGITGAVLTATLFMAGCLVALLLCLILWRLQPYASARKAVAAIYQALEIMLSELSMGRLRETVHRQAVRNAIERARALTVQLDAGHGNSLMRVRLEASLATAERLFTAMLAIEHLFEIRGPRPFEKSELARLAASCREAARQVQRLEPATQALKVQAERVLARDVRSSDEPSAHLLRICADALLGLASALMNAQANLDISAAARRFARPSAAIWRHAGRLSIALVLTQAVCLYFRLDYAYWALIAALLVVQPAGFTTLTRSLERLVGSIAGSILAAVLGNWLHEIAPLMGAITILALCAVAMRGVNYTMLVLFLTSLFVLVADLVTPGPRLAALRAEDNIVGAIIGLACVVFLWPERDSGDMTHLLQQALAGNLEYAAYIMDGINDAPTRAAMATTQRDAGVATIGAEFARGGLPLLGGLTASSVTGRRAREHIEILRALRRLSGEATLLRFDMEAGLRHANPVGAAQLREMAQYVRSGNAEALKQVVSDLTTGQILQMVAATGAMADRSVSG